MYSPTYLEWILLGGTFNLSYKTSGHQMALQESSGYFFANSEYRIANIQNEISANNKVSSHLSISIL